MRLANNIRAVGYRYRSHAAERVRARIVEWLKQEGHGSKKRLARAVSSLYGKSKGQAWVTGIMKGRERKGQDLRLQDLDAVADVLGVPPGDLVRRDSDHYIEVTYAEMRMIKHFRKLPITIQTQALTVLEFLFAAYERELDSAATEAKRRTDEAAEARRARQDDLKTRVN